LKYSSKKLEEKAMGGGVLDQSKEGKKVHLPVACKQCAFPEHTFHSEFVLPINKNQITQMNFHDVMWAQSEQMMISYVNSTLTE